MKRRATLDDIDAAINRWETRLFRAVHALEIYKKARRRIAAKQKEAVAVALKENKPVPPPPVIEVPAEPADDLAIPANLKRQPNAADEKAKAEILAAQEQTKKAKAKASAEKSRAKARGELRKMPLQGKAALEAIRQQG